MTFKHELYLKIDTENVKLNIDAPKKITLKAELEPLPEQSNGLVYLGGSPYGGTKNVTILPSDNPEIVNIKVPLRKLTSPLTLPEDIGSGNSSGDGTYKLKAPSQTLYLEYQDTGWVENYTSIPEGTRWPPLGAEEYTTVNVSIETLLDELLYSEMAFLYAIDEEFPGSLTGFHTNKESEMDSARTMDMSTFLFSFWGFAEEKKGYIVTIGETTSIFVAYRVQILQYHDYWNSASTPILYDKRDVFFNAISESAEHPFFRYLARCRGSNPLLSNVLNAIQSLDVEQPYYNKLAGLLFMTRIADLPGD